MQRLVGQCRQDEQFDFLRFLAEAYTKAEETKNPSFEGWIYEFDIDKRIQEANDNHEKFVSTDNPNTFTVDSYITYPNEKKNDTLIQLVSNYFNEPQNSKKSFWLKPDLWRNPAFDFLCFQLLDSDLLSSSLSFSSPSSIFPSPLPSKRLRMIALNGTRGRSHPLKLSFLQTIAKDFSENSDWSIGEIKFFFVVPTRDGFQVGAVTGDLQQFGWQANLNEMLKRKFVDIFPLRPRKRKA